VWEGAAAGMTGVGAPGTPPKRYCKPRTDPDDPIAEITFIGSAANNRGFRSALTPRAHGSRNNAQPASLRSDQGWPASPERVAGFTWNPRPASRGMGGQLPRNTQSTLVSSKTFMNGAELMPESRAHSSVQRVTRSAIRRAVASSTAIETGQRIPELEKKLLAGNSRYHLKLAPVRPR
jgi:hypothetical protein